MTTPQADQRLERGQRTRERLVEEAIRLFAVKGFDAVSTRELALACGVNAAAINFHFGGKAGLYAAVIGQVSEYLSELYKDTVQAASELPAGLAALEAVRGMLARMTEGLLSAGRSRWMSLLIQRELIAPSDAFERIYKTGLLPVLAALERAVAAVSGPPDGDTPPPPDAIPARADTLPAWPDAPQARTDAIPARAGDPPGRADRARTLAFALFAMISSFSRSRETYLKWTDRDAYTPEDAAYIGGVLAGFAVSGLAGAAAPSAWQAPGGDRP
jgi:AcrR family transcriptional regulator